ncbi:sugar transporter SWEET1 isoform X4 [Kogia breviceps]
MRMTRSVDSVQFLPFLTTDVNNLSWLSYGALKGNWTLIFVNAVGAVLQTLYILVYLYYCHRKHAVLLQTATLLGVLVLGFGYFWLLVPDTETRLQQLGLFCSVFTISMYLSPLADLVSGGVQGGKEDKSPIARDCSLYSRGKKDPNPGRRRGSRVGPRSFVLSQPNVSPFHSPLPPSSPLPPGRSMGFD